MTAFEQMNAQRDWWQLRAKRIRSLIEADPLNHGRADGWPERAEYAEGVADGLTIALGLLRSEGYGYQ